MQLTNRGCSDMMNAYNQNPVQKDLVDTLRRKQKIYKELPKDRSGRNDPIGREFYRRAEKEDEAVSIVTISLLCLNCVLAFRHEGFHEGSSA